MNSAENVSDERLAEIEGQLGSGRQAISFDESLAIVRELQALRSPPTEDADRVEVVGRYADAIKRMREALDLHDAEVADELASEGERADLWTDIEVLVEDLRTLLYASPYPETVGVNDARLGEAIYRAMYQHKGSDWEANETKQVWTEIGARFRQFAAALRFPPTEDGDRVEPVARAFRNADGLDWNWLDNQIGDSGHGKFWKAVMIDARAALSKDTPDV